MIRSDYCNTFHYNTMYEELIVACKFFLYNVEYTRIEYRSCNVFTTRCKGAVIVMHTFLLLFLCTPCTYC